MQMGTPVLCRKMSRQPVATRPDTHGLLPNNHGPFSPMAKGLEMHL